jgi:DNA-binding beta-propeller fold protein YncE
MLAGAGGSAPEVRAQRMAQGPQPTITLPTALAVDQTNDFVFVTTGDFNNQTAGATGPGRLLILATAGDMTHSIRSIPVGDGPASVLVDPRADRVLVVNLGGGDQYAGYSGSSVSVFDLAALEHGGPKPLLHTTPLHGQLAQQAIMDRTTGRTFVAGWSLAGSGQAGKGSVSIIDTHTGALLHTMILNAVPLALALDEMAGQVLVLYGGLPTADLITVLDTHTGRPVRTFPVGPTIPPLAVDGRTDHLFVASRQGIQMRSARDGALLRTVSLGQMPATIVVDTSHGHIFVVTEGSMGANDQFVSNGTLCMLDARTGALLGRVSVGLDLPYLAMFTGAMQPTIVVNGSGNLTFVANTSGAGTGGSPQRHGSISAIRVTSAGLHPPRTTKIGANGAIPLALVLDTTTNRVYVTTMVYSAAGVPTIGLAILDGHSGTVIGTVPFLTKPIAQALGRSGQTATLLANGQVSVAGGFNRAVTLALAEIHDPKAGTWTSTRSMDGALPGTP